MPEAELVQELRELKDASAGMIGGNLEFVSLRGIAEDHDHGAKPTESLTNCVPALDSNIYSYWLGKQPG